MSQKKPILILCTDYQSGQNYYMKHLGNVNYNKKVGDDDWTHVYVITDLAGAQIMLRDHRKIDVDGCILPEFWENPEQAKILLVIQKHKFNIDRQLAVQFLKAIAPSTKT